MFRGIALDGFERTVLKNQTRYCPRCGAPVRFAYRRKRRLILLRERLALEVDADRCSDPACPLRAGFGPPEEARLALPKFQSGDSVSTPRPRVDDDGHTTEVEVRHASGAEAESPAPPVFRLSSRLRPTARRSTAQRRMSSNRIVVTVPSVDNGLSNAAGLPTTTVING